MGKLFHRLKPGWILILSYLGAIVVGTFLLKLPLATPGEGLSLVDALFTATSAICVTGLVVVDTGSAFTLFGQGVIAVLIQLGGLGIMTFSVFFLIVLGQRVSIKSTKIFMDSFTSRPMPSLWPLLKSIFLFTFLTEILGALALYWGWEGPYSPLEKIFLSLFHAVSAFCNAGFCLFSDSLSSYSENYLVCITVMLLIILGGIGFPVIYELSKFRERKQNRRRLSLHTKVVLTVTAVLTLGGAVFIWGVENQNALRGFGLSGQALNAFFQSVTARTAGFNTVDTSTLSNATIFCVIFLMFFGASPGSCGGGIKTTTLAVLAGMVINRFRGDPGVHLFRRTLPREVVSRAVAITILSVFFISLTTELLLLLQVGHISHHVARGRFLEYLFEVVSAFGTVGLSMGATSGLNLLSKLVVIVVMLVGRVGVLVFAYSIARREKSVSIQYAEEKIMVG